MKTALATSEEARRRLEVIVGQLRHEKFGARSEKLHSNQHHLPLEEVEIAQGVLDAAQETAVRNQGVTRSSRTP
ncbi:transposase [Bradyrhizobium canariense]|nr:transposase [Bradyrhizobium canariense]